MAMASCSVTSHETSLYTLEKETTLLSSVHLLPDSQTKAKQSYEAFLVLDIEATCDQETGFDFPNETIEFPVCLMRWKDRSDDFRASQLEVIGEFHSFVKPTWQPILTKFCKSLTGITQKQVDAAPIFSDVLLSFREFLVKHKLVDEQTDRRLVRFCWCSDGPFDVRDFLVKQCFISKVPIPEWMQGDFLDVRIPVRDLLRSCTPSKTTDTTKIKRSKRHPKLNIPAQLKALSLPSFEGRRHSGIDDCRNVARIVAELARRGVPLRPNTHVNPNRRWKWMGKRGQILDGHWNLK